MPEALGPHALDMLRFAGEALSPREIRERLGLSQQRVKGDMKRILGKLGAGSHVEVALRANEQRLI